MFYQLLKNALPRDAEIDCAVCGGAAEHRLLVSPVELLRTPRLPIAVPPERRGLCHECGRGRHSLSFLDDEEILHQQRRRMDATLAAAAVAAAPTAAEA